MAENNKTTAIIDANALAAAEQAAASSTDSYTHKFRQPFVYMKETFDELHFDWGSLLGIDALAIESELQALGMALIVPSFSGP